MILLIVELLDHEPTSGKTAEQYEAELLAAMERAEIVEASKYPFGIPIPKPRKR